MYDLNLKLPIGNFGWKDIEEGKKIKEKLESFTDFSECLAWYNKNIISLAAYEKNYAHIYYEWGTRDQRIKVFCDCPSCKANTNYDVEKEKVFLKLRQQEVERITNSINQRNTYQEKLAFLFSVKGFHADRSLIIKDQYEDYNPLIDLRPHDKQQNKVLNDFVIVEWKSEFLTNNNFNGKWNGFNFEKEKHRFLQTVSKAVDKGKTLVKYIITEIENHFNYSPENLSKKHINEHVLKDMDQQLKYFGHIPNLFAKLINGIVPDLSDVNLYSGTYSEYVHIQEIVKFYRFLHHPLEQIINKGNKKNKIENEIQQLTTHDKMLRFLGIVENIFKAQNLEQNINAWNTYVFDEYNKSSEGRFLTTYDLYANTKLLTVQEYKQELTQRYEQTANPTLLINQVAQIKERAERLIDFYNAHLIIPDPLVVNFHLTLKEFEVGLKQILILKENARSDSEKMQFEKDYKSLFEKKLEFTEKHQAQVYVNDYYIRSIYLGKSEKQFHRNYFETYNERYLFSNEEFIRICQSLIEFCGNFFPKEDYKGNFNALTTPIIQSEIETIINHIDNALLSIYNAKKTKTFRCDFISLLKNLLSNPHHKNWKHQVNRYFSVLNDLFVPVRHQVSKLKFIDEKNNCLVYESYTIHSNKSGIDIDEDFSIPYENTTFASISKKVALGDSTVIPITKLSDYLQDISQSSEQVIELWALGKEYKELFSYYGYEKESISISFEKYVEWVQQIKVRPETKNVQQKDIKAVSLNQLFSNNETKIIIIKEAIKDLNITSAFSERQLTGFINACKEADALPSLADKRLLEIIYAEIGKPFNTNSKPRYENKAYFEMKKKTEKYFGLK